MNNKVSSSPEERRSAVRGGLLTAGVFGALAIIGGAWAAHGLEDWLLNRGIDSELASERVDQFDVAARYHLVHAVVLLALVAVRDHLSVTSLRWILRLMVAGILLFSGSLYLLVVTNTPWLGAVTPLGGLSWVAAWSWLAIAGWRGIQ